MEHSGAEEILAELNRQWERAAEGGCRRTVLQLCGQPVELQFPAGAQTSLLEGSLKGWLAQTEQRPQAVFRFWTSGQDLPAGPPPRSGVYACREKDGRGVYRAKRWLLGADPLRGVYTCCWRPERPSPLPYWLTSLTVSFWAQASGLLPMHGAAVGTGGRGMLIAAESGGGKSTLAVACLLAGMELVSDDCLLLTAQGPLRAMPLYSVVKLAPDMEERLRPGLPTLWVDQGRGGKRLLDASGCPLSPGLEIGAIVFPCLGDGSGPELIPARGPLALRLAKAAAGQVGGIGGPERLRALAERLSGLPAYELRLSFDTEKNAAALRDLIEKGF